MTLPYSCKCNPNLLFSIITPFLDSVDEIVETGTCDGDGSTLAFAQTEKPVFTLECNPWCYQTALSNLNQFVRIKPIYALSLSRLDMLRFILDDHDIYERKDIAFDKPNKFESMVQYCSEICVYDGNQENALAELLDRPCRQLVFLDSCGGTGWLEFESFIQHPLLLQKTLLLDDIKHIKHIRSVEYIKSKFSPETYYEIGGRFFIFTPNRR